MLEEVKSFRYLESFISYEVSKSDILSRIAKKTADLSRWKPIWRDKNISLASKAKLMMGMLTLSTFLYARESMTEKKTLDFVMRCYRKLLDITCKDHGTYLEARNKFLGAVGKHGDFLSVLKKRKLRWYGHISRASCMA